MPAATGTAICGRQYREGVARGLAGTDAVQTETAVRLKWLRAVRALHMMACRWQVPPAQQPWSSDVQVPIGGDSSADASHHRPSGAAHNSGSRSHASAPHPSSGHAVAAPLGSCRGSGEAGNDAALSEQHSAELASSDWRTAWSHGSGGVSHSSMRTLQGLCSGGQAQISEKRHREGPVEGEGSQVPPSAEHACSHDESAGQLAAGSRQQRKRQRTEVGWSANAAPLGQRAEIHQVLGSQPAEAMDAQEASAGIDTAHQAELHTCAPAAMEADSVVDIGGPDDWGQPVSSGNTAPGDHPFTQVRCMLCRMPLSPKNPIGFICLLRDKHLEGNMMYKPCSA